MHSISMSDFVLFVVLLILCMLVLKALLHEVVLIMHSKGVNCVYLVSLINNTIHVEKICS